MPASSRTARLYVDDVLLWCREHCECRESASTIVRATAKSTRHGEHQTEFSHNCYSWRCRSEHVAFAVRPIVPVCGHCCHSFSMFELSRTRCALVLLCCS